MGNVGAKDQLHRTKSATDADVMAAHHGAAKPLCIVPAQGLVDGNPAIRAVPPCKAISLKRTFEWPLRRRGLRHAFGGVRISDGA